MASCCNNVFYCVAGNIVSQPPGPAPVGFSAGPWATLAEARIGCPVPDVSLSGCCATTVKLPGEIWVNFTDVTGWLIGIFPNSVKVIINPGSLNGTTNINFSPPVGACVSFQVSIVAACDTGLDRWGVNVQIATAIGCGCGGSSSGTGSSPWAFYGAGTGAVAWYQKFPCSNSWPLSAPEVAGTGSLVCTAGAASFKVTISR